MEVQLLKAIFWAILSVGPGILGEMRFESGDLFGGIISGLVFVLCTIMAMLFYFKYLS